MSSAFGLAAMGSGPTIMCAIVNDISLWLPWHFVYGTPTADVVALELPIAKIGPIDEVLQM